MPRAINPRLYNILREISRGKSRTINWQTRTSFSRRLVVIFSAGQIDGRIRRINKGIQAGIIRKWGCIAAAFRAFGMVSRKVFRSSVYRPPHEVNRYYYRRLNSRSNLRAAPALLPSAVMHFRFAWRCYYSRLKTSRRGNLKTTSGKPWGNLNFAREIIYSTHTHTLNYFFKSQITFGFIYTIVIFSSCLLNPYKFVYCSDQDFSNVWIDPIARISHNVNFIKNYLFEISA